MKSPMVSPDKLFHRTRASTAKREFYSGGPLTKYLKKVEISPTIRRQKADNAGKPAPPKSDLQVRRVLPVGRRPHAPAREGARGCVAAPDQRAAGSGRERG